MFSFRRGKIKYIIAGLGNPGPKYANTRHNAGFKAVDLLAKKEGFEIKKSKFQALIADERIGSARCLIMKPQTRMNLRGGAVREAEPNENIIVIYDDISLDIGKTRIRRKGSAGGHNGIKSIISCLGSEEFPRVKIGVDKKPNASYDLAKWVLSDFPSEKADELNHALENSVEAVRLIVNGNIDEAMNKYNS